VVPRQSGPLLLIGTRTGSDEMGLDVDIGEWRVESGELRAES